MLTIRPKLTPFSLVVSAFFSVRLAIAQTDPNGFEEVASFPDEQVTTR